MKISFWSIGKNHEAYIKPGVEDFTKRINKYFKADWNIISPPKNAGVLSEGDLKKKEAQLILEMLGRDDYLVALDERGKSFSSESLAAFIQSRANESTRQLIFFIGGAYGIDKSLLQRANHT